MKYLDFFLNPSTGTPVNPSSNTPVNPSGGRAMTPMVPPIERIIVKVSDYAKRSTLLVSKCIRVPTLSELKNDDTAIS